MSLIFPLLPMYLVPGLYALASLDPGRARLALIHSDASYLSCINRYFIRVTIARRIAEVVKERDLWVHSYRMPPDSNNSIKMEVGIEDCLHIEFEYNKSKCVCP